MSGIYIPGMEMPTSCFECRFSIDGFCYASGHVNIRANEERQITNYCPLIPVPPHGDLIDRDALPWEKQSLMVADEGWSLPCVLIEDAPTIITADKEGET